MNYFRIHMLFISLIFLFALYQSIYIMVNDKTPPILKVLALVVFFCVVYLGLRRNTYLPFLGPTVLPSSLLKDLTDTKMGDVHVKVPIDAPDATKVVYWAAVPSTKVLETPFEAYHDFRNMGVASVKNKEAIFHIECPASYKVPFTVLKPHVHYRLVYPNGLLGSVQTMFVNCAV